MALKRFWGKLYLNLIYLKIYVVNLFDTGIVCRELKFESYSFKYLLFRYCGVHTDKQF